MQKCCRETKKIYFKFNSIFRKSFRLRDHVEKYCQAGQAKDDKIIWSKRFIFRINKARIQTHTHTLIISFVKKPTNAEGSSGFFN
jgi:hypothetical protein